MRPEGSSQLLFIRPCSVNLSMNKKTQSKKITHALSHLHRREPYKKAEQPKFCVSNLLTTTAQQPFPTQCFTEAARRPGSSPCVYCQTQDHCFGFCPLFWGAPLPLLLFLKCKQGKRSGWRVGMGQGGTGEEMGNRWVRGRGVRRSGAEGQWKGHGFITHYIKVWACFSSLSAFALVGDGG